MGENLSKASIICVADPSGEDGVREISLTVDIMWSISAGQPAHTSLSESFVIYCVGIVEKRGWYGSLLCTKVVPRMCRLIFSVKMS